MHYRDICVIVELYLYLYLWNRRKEITTSQTRGEGDSSTKVNGLGPNVHRIRLSFTQLVASYNTDIVLRNMGFIPCLILTMYMFT